MSTTALTFIFVLVFWIFSLCLHEFSHAVVAYIGGDTTVKEKGYLSFNPLKYTDPMMSLVWPVIILLIGGIALPGGAVYIERHLLKNRNWDAMVSAAGPASNILLAIILALPFSFGILEADGSPLVAAYAMVVSLQVVAAMLNLLPIPPLDGFGIISAYMEPGARARAYQFGAQWGLLIILVLFFVVEPFQVFFWTIAFQITEAIGVPIDLAIEGWENFPTGLELLGG